MGHLTTVTAKAAAPGCSIVIDLPIPLGLQNGEWPKTQRTKGGCRTSPAVPMHIGAFIGFSWAPQALGSALHREKESLCCS
jgi:hypothetical protein